jgi:transcriptional regulator with XRE-family HTH domain
MADLVVVPPESRYMPDLRVQAGLTQPQLAKALGISTTTLSSIEWGYLDIGADLLDRYAEVVGTSRAELLATWERTHARPPGPPE